MSHKCDGCRYKSEHQEMGFKPFGICTKGTSLLAADELYRANKCPYKQTNFDRIKTMNIEEMAELLERSANCENYCAFVDEDGMCIGEPGDYCGCLTGVKKWLETEVEA